MQHVALETVWRDHAPRLRAVLTRRLGDFDLAEEALADALAQAAARWPVEGTPGNPAGWLVTAAWHSAVDRFRRDAVGSRKLALLAASLPAGGAATSVPSPDADADDRLGLIFACCHPALPDTAQVALTLYAVGGLTTEEIAAAFLTPRATMAQRLTRAKHSLREAGVRFTPPEPEDLAERLRSVLAVVYLIYNEGYSTDRRLAREGLELAQQLHGLMPGECEVAGLAVLLELHEARAAARFDAAGRIVLLADQDRTAWDRGAIDRAVARLDATLVRGHPGAYQVQAAIAALHATAATYAETDWPQIRALYGSLFALTGNPVALLNRAVATWQSGDPVLALGEVESLRDALGSYRLFHATRGELLRALGRPAEAVSAIRQALSLTTTPAEKDLLLSRL